MNVTGTDSVRRAGVESPGTERVTGTEGKTLHPRLRDCGRIVVVRGPSGGKGDGYKY